MSCPTRNIKQVHIRTLTLMSCLRTHWKPLFSPQTTLLQLFGMPVIAGNGNLFQQNYRVCNITRRVESCPAALRFVDYSSHADSDVTLIFSDVSCCVPFPKKWAQYISLDVYCIGLHDIGPVLYRILANYFKCHVC